jgi:hypothetical protein
MAQLSVAALAKGVTLAFELRLDLNHF